jgi:3-demethoxyubiquinol 3-hydroxylase
MNKSPFFGADERFSRGVRASSRVQGGVEALMQAADTALRTLWAAPQASRPNPAARVPVVLDAQGEVDALTPEEKRLAGALMRVNHVGEVCAQALYSAQAVATQDAALKAQFVRAAQEETDHLAWTAERLAELGDRPSLLNPLWYAGAFGLGLVAGRLGDRVSLGFLVETERQVEAHLQSHLEQLPQADAASRAIVTQMKADEAVHADEAAHAGAAELPAPAKALMRAMSRVMTRTAHVI